MKLELITLTSKEILCDDGLALQRRIINSQPEFNRALGGPANLPTEAIRQDVESVLALGGEYILFEKNEQIVGISHVLTESPHDGHPWIGLLVLDAASAGKGLGRAASDLLKEYLNKNNSAPIRLCVQQANLPALAFWQRCGFNIVKESIDEENRLILILQSGIDTFH